MQVECEAYGKGRLLQFAIQNEIIRLMPESKRGQDEIVRQNLLYVAKACSERLEGRRGGQSYLARLLGSTPQYVSSVIKGYENRNLGREHKTRIEQLFKLDPDWMDRAHDDSVVSWLVSRVPSLPHERNRGTRAFQPGYGRLVGTIAELQRQIDELKSQLASKSNTRK